MLFLGTAMYSLFLCGARGALQACIRCECVREAYLQCCPAKQQKRREKWDRLEAEVRCGTILHLCAGE